MLNELADVESNPSQKFLIALILHNAFKIPFDSSISGRLIPLGAENEMLKYKNKNT